MMNMLRRRGGLLVLWLAVAACTPRITPQQTATALLNPLNNSLTEARNGVAISVRIDTLAVQPLQLNETLTAFHIIVDNRTDQPVSVPAERFILKDGQARQHRPVTPERVMEIVSKDTVYLIPYPYVGYYYLEDREYGTSRQAMASSLPFYAEYHPQDIYTRALPIGPVLPRSSVAGTVYFLTDLTRTDRAELLIFDDASLEGEPGYRFPFAVTR